MPAVEIGREDSQWVAVPVRRGRSPRPDIQANLLLGPNPGDVSLLTSLPGVGGLDWVSSWPRHISSNKKGGPRCVAIDVSLYGG